MSQWKQNRDRRREFADIACKKTGKRSKLIMQELLWRLEKMQPYTAELDALVGVVQMMIERRIQSRGKANAARPGDMDGDHHGSIVHDSCGDQLRNEDVAGLVHGQQLCGVHATSPGVPDQPSV